ncbi:MAG: polysaccharide pyruvyl transferase family protein, partial [Firmicutes bacterium]|nr:polysaccharide pyruvyl transferase family protein [Bacillota bacterium]
IVVDLSGDGYSDEMGAIATILHSLYLFPAIILRKKVYVCAQSIGPFYSWYTKAIAKWTLNRVDILTAREHITKKYLDSMLRRKTILTGDCAFLMDSKQSEKVDSIIKKNGLEYKKIIGISVSKRMSRWALPDISMKDKYNKIIEIIADFIDNQTVKKDIYIMLVPHVMGPPGKVDDRVVQRDVYKKVKNKRKVILIEEELMPDEMKELIGYSYVFIGARMHSLIAAISMGIPVIALGYSHKYIGLIGEVMDNFVIDLRKVESKKMLYMLIKKLKILNMENDFYCNKIACSISRLKVNAMKNIDFMANWIN